MAIYHGGSALPHAPAARRNSREFRAGAPRVLSPSGGGTGGGRSAPLAPGLAPVRRHPTLPFPRLGGRLSPSLAPASHPEGLAGDTAAVLAPGSHGMRLGPIAAAAAGAAGTTREGERKAGGRARRALTCAQGAEQYGGGQQPHGGAAAVARPGAATARAAPQRAGGRAGGGGMGGGALAPLIGCSAGAGAGPPSRTAPLPPPPHLGAPQQPAGGELR